MNLLVVDDNPAILEILSDAMGLCGHHVDTAKDGIDAMALQEAHHYDVVITDAHMPGLCGFDLCRAIKARFPEVKIIGMTGSLSMAGFRNAGADLCLAKPFSIDRLRDAVENRLFAVPRSGTRRTASGATGQGGFAAGQREKNP
jgi:two-component system sensor histidine kinase EvgS